MPIVEFLPSLKTVEVPAGTELLVAARQAGVEIVSPCGGKGTCGKCLVRVLHGEVEVDSQASLSHAALAEGCVLACKSRVQNSPVTIEVPEQIGQEGGKFSDTDETYLVRRELLPKEWEFDPLAIKWLFHVPPAELESGLSDLDRLTRTIQRDWGKAEVIYPLAVMRRTAQALRDRGGEVTATIVRDAGRLHVVRIEAGDTTTRHFGIAVDVGTTTVAVQLINLTRGAILSTRSDYNDQVACGLDVISRINYALRPERLEELRRRIVDTINRLIAQVSKSNGVDAEEICNAVISGNTTMTHLLLGMSPEYIRLHPYTPTVLETPYLTAADIGVRINPDSWIYLSPCVGSYVGGDITAGVLCTDLAMETDEVSLFIDIGTNGELVLGNRDFMTTCACSAGPAFEGGGIECGMRASLGAIEKVDVDPASGKAKYRTIGSVKPKGICGSGIIDLLANLFTTGFLDPSGRFDRSRPCSFIEADGRRLRYVIAPAHESGTGRAVTISETDIENIIRAKAAIYSAMALMLKQVGMGFDDVAHMYIAGGFGRFLDLEKAVIIGLAPDIPRSKFHYIGNSSLMGSYMVAVSQDYRQRQLDLARRMTCLELSTDPTYMDQYTGAMFLPHTDPGQFPSVVQALARVRQGKRA